MKKFTKKLAVILSIMYVFITISALHINAIEIINLNVGSKLMAIIGDGDGHGILLSDDTDVVKTELAYGSTYYIYGVGVGSATLYQLDDDFNVISTCVVTVTEKISDIIGDVNSDEVVDINDAKILQQYLVGKVSKITRPDLADIDKDGNINVFDVIFLKRIIAYDIYPNQNIPDTTTPTDTTTTTTTTATTTTTTITTTTITTTTLNAKEKAREYAEEVLELVNQEREAVGVSPLVFNEKLFEAAMIRADEITELFDHDRPDGTECFTILDELGIKYYNAAENIAAGYSTPTAVVNGWMKSPGHKANILDPDLTELGVGYVYKSGAGYGYYWVQLFI